MAIPTVLFVCMGNICRSPVVEAVARAEFARAGFEATVASAGTHGYHIGDGADPRSIASARAAGYDVSKHRAAQVDAATLGGYDAVLVMDRVNLRDIARYCTGARPAQPQLFLPYAGIDDGEEVPDPYYGTGRDFERVIELARAGVQGLIRRGRLGA
jgi:protein-tyrosine phosphatase